MMIEEGYTDTYENTVYLKQAEPLKETSSTREIGGDAVWTLSSAKTGNGVDQLRDDCVETFWQ